MNFLQSLVHLSSRTKGLPADGKKFVAERKIKLSGADAQICTADLVITNDVLYYLSYIGKCGRGRTCTYEGETPTDLQSVAFAAQPHAHFIIYITKIAVIQ